MIAAGSFVNSNVEHSKGIVKRMAMTWFPELFIVVIIDGGKGMRNLNGLVKFDLNLHDLRVFMLELLIGHSLALGVMYM